MSWYNIWNNDIPKPIIMGFVHVTEPSEYPAENSGLAFKAAREKFPDIIALAVAGTTARKAKGLIDRYKPGTWDVLEV